MFLRINQEDVPSLVTLYINADRASQRATRGIQFEILSWYSLTPEIIETNQSQVHKCGQGKNLKELKHPVPEAGFDNSFPEYVDEKILRKMQSNKMD
ncbi:14726_t:CDS:2, partial [Racocetra persica]